MRMKRTHVFLPQPAINQLQALAEKTGLSISRID
jgi:hypothetical protein